MAWEKNVDVIIVDDDEIAGKLAAELLSDANFTVSLVTNPSQALAEIKNRRPKAVIMDLFLKGINGIELCRAVKSDPETKNTKLIILTNKNYEAEKQQAFAAGAEVFIPKNQDVRTFAMRIGHIISGNVENIISANPKKEDEKMQEKETAPSQLKDNMLNIKIWGLRSLPAAIPSSENSWGSQTPCVSVETGKNIFIFDAGTGISALGKQLCQTLWPKDIWIFLSQFELGHVMGLSNFACAQNPNFNMRMAGPGESGKKVKETIRGMFYGSVFWHSKRPRAKLLAYEIYEDNYEITDGVKLSAMYANHPSLTLCMRLEINGKKIVYAPSNEVGGESGAFENFEDKLAEFVGDADLVIHDGFYSDQDYNLHVKEGHSCPSNAMEFIEGKTKAKQLILFNVNGSYSQEDLDEMSQKISAVSRDAGGQTKCQLARENLSIQLKD
ncbi:MAG: response regulator [Elusimicrobia bacterium]|nr:response regulator [Elusimicrobiota bacterium]